MKQLQGILILFAFISVYPQQDTSLVLSEIMFMPQTGNNEFIEIYNSSISQPVNLNGFKIKYYTASADIIIDAGWGTILQPQSYAVIFEGDYDFSTGIYYNIIPSEALKLKISDNSFGATGMSNTSDRPVLLLDTSSLIIDNRFYTADNTIGYSEEKIIMNHDTTDNNWSNSELFNGTPGKRNSVTCLNYDLALQKITILPNVPVAGENILIKSQIKNKGLNTASTFETQFYNDMNHDSIPSPQELISSESGYNLLPGDSVISEALLNNPLPGNYHIISRIIFEPDEDTLNNTGYHNFVVYQGNEINDLVFNEIMYAPSGGMPEWVELYNRSGSDLNLRNRRISDNSTSVYLTREDFILKPDSFVVVSKDSSILNYFDITSQLLVINLPSLNNSGDDLVVNDSSGIYFDSVAYMPEWGGNSGRSLERISSELPSNNSSSWGTSVSIYRGTPGWINSISAKENDLMIRLFQTIPSYGITGENIIIKTIVKNAGTNISGSYNLRFFDDVNKDSTAQLSELFLEQNCNPLNSYDSITFDISYSSYLEGKNYLIAQISVNPDDDPTNNTAFTDFMGVVINETRNDLVINEFMYAPASPEPEWIEIYNRSNKIVEMKNYCLSDNNDTSKVNDELLSIYPGEFLVFASDSSILNFYTLTGPLIISDFPALNNSGDKILLMDSLYRIIDSLVYYQSWGTAGKSLEKIIPDNIAVDSSSWRKCISKNNGTPGYINSVSEKEHDILVKAALINPVYPQKGENVSISAKIFNNGIRGSIFKLELFADINLDSIPDQLIETLNGLTLQAYDSSTFSFNYMVNNLQEKLGFFIISTDTADQDTSNNYLYSFIYPGYSPGEVVINEIMYSPEGGEPEWIELYNRMDIAADISDWELSDIITTPSQVMLEKEIYVEAKSYYIISRDSSIINYHRELPCGFTTAGLPVLNNDIDGVVLKDSRGQTMDSLKYTSSWGGKEGFSLERKSTEESSLYPMNWSSSRDIEKSTPGRLNSTTIKKYDLAVTGISFDPRFPIMSEDVTISTGIINYGTDKAENFIVNFYIRNDTPNEPDSLLSSHTIANLNPDDSLNVTSSAVIKIDAAYLITTQIIYEPDLDVYNNNCEKNIEPGLALNTILINELMYDPAEEECEWIEFINVSNETVNIKDWMIEDISSGDKTTLSLTDMNIKKGEYFITAYDTSFFFKHPDADYKIIIADLTSLGNNGDGIILYDFREGIIDSLYYKSNWGGRNGYSLERISIERLTGEGSNWTSCLNPSKSTPGKFNSIEDIREYSWNEAAINEILADPDIDNCEFIEIINISDDSLNTGGWRLEDNNGNYQRLSDSKLLIPPGGFYTVADDSILIDRYNLKNNNYIRIINSALGLTNTGEVLLLKDVRGNMIDSVFYSDKWHSKGNISNKNISLERINPMINSNEKNNWSSSLSQSGATPGEANSIFCENPLSGQNISVSPNPFSPDNDGYEDHCIINYKLNTAVSRIRIKIFDSHGRQVRTLLNDFHSGNTGSVIFDGRNDNGMALRIGIYIIFLEAVNEISGTPDILKTTVVIARKL